MSKKPTAKQKEFHLWLMREFPCVCGCGKPSSVVHHPLTEHPLQRTRRNHEFVVPMDGFCHMALHSRGCERKFRPDVDWAGEAFDHRQLGQQEGLL